MADVVACRITCVAHCCFLVDVIAQPRIQSCCKILRKYGTPKFTGRRWVCRVYCGDGCRFNVPPPQPRPASCIISKEHARACADSARECGAVLYLHTGMKINKRRLHKKRPAASAAASPRPRKVPRVSNERTDACGSMPATSTAAPPPGPAQSYDRVIVDAECTHDGSIKHISKFHQLGWERFEELVLEPERISKLELLQRGLAWCVVSQ